MYLLFRKLSLRAKFRTVFCAPNLSNLHKPSLFKFGFSGQLLQFWHFL